MQNFKPARLKGSFMLMLFMFIGPRCDVKSWSALNYGKVKSSLICSSTPNFNWLIGRPVNP